MTTRWFEGADSQPSEQMAVVAPTTSSSTSAAATCAISESSSGLQQLCDSRPLAAVAAGLIVGAILFWWAPPLVRCAHRSTYEAHNEYIAEVSIGKVLFWCIVTGIAVYLIVPLIAKAKR